MRREAFTLIEVIVSVIIISLVVMTVMQMSTRNVDNAVYLSKRNITAFQDSLYLTDRVNSYHKDEKEAYDLLQPPFRIDEDESKTALKDIKRQIVIPEPLTIPPLQEGAPSAQIERVILKDAYTSHYYRFKLQL